MPPSVKLTRRMPWRRSGKSSISKVVFHKLAPQETLFLETTNKISKDEVQCVHEFFQSLHGCVPWPRSY